jgi:hypothetical protein
MIRPDYIFSYWIVVWYLFYKTDLLSYNPKFALYVGLFENVFVLFSMIYHKVILRNILFFVAIILIFKVIPLWTIWNTELKPIDIQATFALFILYLAWLLWNKKLDTLHKGYTEMLKTHNQMPGMTLLTKLFL